MRSLLITILILFNTVCFGQKYQLYVGKVEGVTKDIFVNNTDEFDKVRDSIFSLKPISESTYPVEIRMYEYVSGNGSKVCTILYYDTAFHFTRKVVLTGGWEKEFKTVEQKPVANRKADSCFAELVKNAIFSLPEYSSIYTGKDILTEAGLIKDNRLCGVTDGLTYIILCKVGEYYKRIYQTSRDFAQLKCYPDNVEIQQRKKIVELLEASIKLVKR